MSETDDQPPETGVQGEAPEYPGDYADLADARDSDEHADPEDHFGEVPDASSLSLRIDRFMLDSTPPDPPPRRNPADSTEIYFRSALPEPDELSGLDVFFERVPTSERQRMGGVPTAVREPSGAQRFTARSDAGPTASALVDAKRAADRNARPVSATQSRLPSEPPRQQHERRGVPTSSEQAVDPDEQRLSASQLALSTAEAALLSPDDVVTFEPGSWTGNPPRVVSGARASVRIAESSSIPQAVVPRSGSASASASAATNWTATGSARTGSSNTGASNTSASNTSASNTSASNVGTSSIGSPHPAASHSGASRPGASVDVSGVPEEDDTGGLSGSVGDGMRAIARQLQDAARPRGESSLPGVANEAQAATALSSNRLSNRPADVTVLTHRSESERIPIETGAPESLGTPAPIAAPASALSAAVADTPTDHADTVPPESRPEDLVAATKPSAFPQAGILRRPKARLSPRFTPPRD